jgi:hypothetical protein
VAALTPEDRALIVEQAIVLLEGCYAHPAPTVSATVLRLDLDTDVARQISRLLFAPKRCGERPHGRESGRSVGCFQISPTSRPRRAPPLRPCHRCIKLADQSYPGFLGG